MPFVLPTFNTRIFVWHDYRSFSSAYASPDDSFMGNLTPGRRVTMWGPDAPTTGLYLFEMQILLPPLTDIRAQTDVAHADLIECPHLSTRFYRVEYVDDIGKGFANEHRIAFIRMASEAVVFTDITLPFPVPLP